MQHLVAIQSRHGNVADDEVGAAGECHFHARQSIGRLEDLESGKCQYLRDIFPYFLLIFYDQYLYSFFHN